MYLKSLELQGFKSFPDKIKLDFKKGLTAVVGPNGSGKSNIGDAVRWVLGEQSTKTLRGGKMEDVIFAGTQQRKSVGFAQVTLNIDNSTRSLASDEDLVSVSRKLYRSGESEYLINGKNVRLKDIVELFMDTGLGRDGYSIIGQGRVAEIVSNKSNERRMIFEEASGISKFRYKKEEAERRLSAAEDNLVRLSDITTELELRVEPLKQQSQKASKFLDFSQQKKDLEISLWLHKLDELKEQIQNNEDKFLISNAEYENLENDIEKIEQQVQQSYSKMQQTTVRIENLRNEILDTEKKNSSVFAEIAVLENDILHLNENISASKDKIEQSNISKSSSDTLIQEQKNLILEIDVLSKELEEKVLQSTYKLNNILAQSNEFNSKLTEKNTLLNGLYIKKTEYSFLISSSKTSIEHINSESKNSENSLIEINKNIDVYSSEKKENEDALENIKNKIVECENKVNGFSKLLEGKLSRLSSSEQEYNSLENKIRELKQRQSILKDLENSMEGFAYSVKEVIKASKSGQLSGIEGSVAQLIKVDSKFTVAIETALGGALQNIIVDNEDTAKRCIKMLKDNKSGRATFLPITSINGNPLSEKNLEMQEGFVGLGCEIVKFDSKYSRIIYSLLGRIVIAEDINTATNIAKKYGYKFRIVTLDGQVVNAGGSFTGGSISKSTGVLSRKNEIETITLEIQKLQTNYDNSKEKVISYRADCDKLKIDLEAQKEALYVFKNDQIKFNSELSHIDAMLVQLEEKNSEIKNNMNSFEVRIQEQNSIISNSEIDLEKCIAEISKTECEINENNLEQDKNHNEREQLSSEISSIRLKQIELSKDKQACNLKIEQLEMLLKNSYESFSQLNTDIEKFNISINNKNYEIESKKQLLKSSEEKTESINKEIKELQVIHQQFEIEANQNRSLERSKNEEKEGISREITKQTERKITIQKDYDSIISQLWEQYQLTRSQAELDAVEINDFALAQKSLNEIKSKIRGLGNVNVAAIEEYKEVSERYEFLSSQLADIKKSKTDLINLIDDLTDNMKELFSANFKIINDNFKKIFVELFGGGKAELTLTDPSDILQSGIEINVAPPGKVIKSLSLLSGGEQAFIAIAIYFAILKLKPSPFCILDEIEAALDDVNVSKFASYLRNFTDTTQFIVITHRRGTMEEADVLYGVTMQEKGISKLLKMDTHENIVLSDRR